MGLGINFYRVLGWKVIVVKGNSKLMDASFFRGDGR